MLRRTAFSKSLSKKIVWQVIDIPMIIEGYYYLMYNLRIEFKNPYKTVINTQDNGLLSF